MKLTYDPKLNIAYIGFKEKTEKVNSIKLSEDVIVDLSADGSVYGIEFLDANHQLFTDHFMKLVFENVLSGKKQEIQLG